MTGWMRGAALGVVAAALALPAHAGEPGAATSPPPEIDLAAPAPTPGTLDYQFAALQAAGASAAVAAPLPGPQRAASVDLARRAVDAAGAFEAYTRKASAIAALKDGPAVIAAVETASSYEASQLQEGAVAYGALAALQDPAFVEAVKAAAPNAAARDALADQLLDRPAAVLRLPGAHETAARITRLVGGRGAALVDAGAGVNKASYTVQHEAWSKAPLAHAEADLKRVKARSGERSVLSVAETEDLMSGLGGLRKEAVTSSEEPGFRPTPATAQALALAALAVLGRAGEDHVADVSRLLSTDQGADCLKLAKLNLYQCLAVAGPHYEDMFCLGRHALSDTGQCVMSTAGWTPPAAASATSPAVFLAAAPVAAPAARAASLAAAVEVPIALASLDGPERTHAYAEPAEIPPPPPVAEERRFAVARADLPSFRDMARPSRLDETENDDAGYRTAPRPALEDATDDEDDTPPARAYGYGRYNARGGYRPAPGYGWDRRRYEDPRASYGYPPPPPPPPSYAPSWDRDPYGDDR